MKSKALRVKSKAVRVWHESGLIFSEKGVVCRRVGKGLIEERGGVFCKKEAKP